MSGLNAPDGHLSRSHDVDVGAPPGQRISVNTGKKRLCSHFEQLLGVEVGLPIGLARAHQEISCGTASLEHLVVLSSSNAIICADDGLVLGFTNLVKTRNNR